MYKALLLVLFCASVTLAQDIAEDSPKQHEPVPVQDESLKGIPYAPGWPIALPGEIMCTPSVADIDGDSKLEIIVTCRKRIEAQPLVHPEPCWAPQLFAFHADGSLVKGFPVKLGEAIITKKPSGIWASSPSVIHDPAGGKDKVAVVASFKHGIRIIDGAGNVAEFPGGNRTNSIPIADLDGDGKPDLLAPNAVIDLEGTKLASWGQNYPFGGAGSCIGDPDGDGKLMIFHQFARANQQNNFAMQIAMDPAGNRLEHYQKKVECDCQFPPVMGDVDGDGKKEIVSTSGDKIFVFRASGEDPDYTHAVGDFTGVLKEGVVANDASPTLADLDGDGKAEIIVFDSQLKAVRAFHGDGKPFGGGEDGVIAPLPIVCRGVSVVDLGGDAVSDIFAGTYWIKLTKEGQPTISNMIPDDQETNYAQPTIADIDGDGKMEVIFGLKDGRLFVFQTGMTCSKKDLQWPTCNGNFQHTGVWARKP